MLPSRGEGWGRPHVEAMAMGLPVIATNWSGITAYLDEEVGYPIQASACGALCTTRMRTVHLVEGRGVCTNLMRPEAMAKTLLVIATNKLVTGAASCIIWFTWARKWSTQLRCLTKGRGCHQLVTDHGNLKVWEAHLTTAPKVVRAIMCATA